MTWVEEQQLRAEERAECWAVTAYQYMYLHVNGRSISLLEAGGVRKLCRMHVCNCVCLWRGRLILST